MVFEVLISTLNNLPVMSTVAYVSPEERLTPIIFSQDENPYYHKVQRLKLWTADLPEEA